MGVIYPSETVRFPQSITASEQYKYNGTTRHSYYTKCVVLVHVGKGSVQVSLSVQIDSDFPISSYPNLQANFATLPNVVLSVTTSTPSTVNGPQSITALYTHYFTSAFRLHYHDMEQVSTYFHNFPDSSMSCWIGKWSLKDQSVCVLYCMSKERCCCRLSWWQ